MKAVIAHIDAHMAPDTCVVFNDPDEAERFADKIRAFRDFEAVYVIEVDLPSTILEAFPQEDEND